MYFPLIDILRFIAAFAVMNFHYFAGSFARDNGMLALFINYGSLGVQLFFIISGFVIYFSLKKPIKEFAVGRFMRLYPLFWVLCTITYIMTVIMPGGNHLSFWGYLRNLLMINDGKYVNLVDNSYWTLTVEVFFYFYIGSFVHFFKLKRLESFYAGWLVLSLASFYFGIYNVIILKLLFVRFAPYFIFGGMMGLIVETWANNSFIAKCRHLLILLASAISPVYISHVLNSQSLQASNNFGAYDYYSSAIVQSFFVLVPIAIYLSLKISSSFFINLAKILGGITYPLYLLHSKIGFLVIGLFGNFGYVSGASILMAMAMVVTSYFIYIYESKARKNLYKNIISGWLNQPQLEMNRSGVAKATDLS